jgi:hypothetical protein
MEVSLYSEQLVKSNEVSHEADESRPRHPSRYAVHPLPQWGRGVGGKGITKFCSNAICFRIQAF